MRKFTVKPKQNVTAASTRSRISALESRIADIKNKLAMMDLYDDRRIDLQMDLAELEESLNFAWQDDEQEYYYALERQEFNPDGSLKGYDDYDDIEASSFKETSYTPYQEDDFDDADLYTVKIWHEVEPSGDTTSGPVADEEIFQMWATSPDEAMEYAKSAWSGPIDRIEVVGINESGSDEDDIIPYDNASLE